MLAAFLGVMIVAIFTIQVRKLYGEATIDAALYNLDTPCITDFTVEGEISQALYADFKSNSRDGVGSIQDLKKFLSEKICAEL